MGVGGDRQSHSLVGGCVGPLYSAPQPLGGPWLVEDEIGIRLAQSAVHNVILSWLIKCVRDGGPSAPYFGWWVEALRSTQPKAHT